MSGDGPLSIDDDGQLWFRTVLPIQRLSPKAAKRTADQLDRARRCAEVEAENARLRAELAARPDLTELRAAWDADGWGEQRLPRLEQIAIAAGELLAANPAPAPTHNHHTRDIRAGCPKCMADHPDINPNDLYAPLVPAPDTVTITVSRAVAMEMADRGSHMCNPTCGQLSPCPYLDGVNAARAALDADR